MKKTIAIILSFLMLVMVFTEEIRAQIQAVYDAGYEEWILWNAANRYTEGGLLTQEEEEQ